MKLFSLRSTGKTVALSALALSLAVGCDSNATSQRSMPESPFGKVSSQQASTNRGSVVGLWGMSSESSSIGKKVSIYEFQSDGMATGTVASSIGTAKFVGQWKEENGKQYLFGTLFALSGSSANSVPHTCELIFQPNGKLAIDGVIHARQ